MEGLGQRQGGYLAGSCSNGVKEAKCFIDRDDCTLTLELGVSRSPLPFIGGLSVDWWG